MTDLVEQKPSRRLWIFAGICALALHVGGAALAISHLQTEEADDALGANAIEIGLELASVRHETTDLPAGPDTDASMASPQLAEQKAEVKETELPKDTPTEAEDPDRRGDAERVEQAKGRRSEDRGGADGGLHRVRLRPKPPPRRVRKPFRKDRARSRRRSAPARPRAAFARRGRRSWSPISTSTSAIRRNASRRPPRSTFALRSTGSVTSSRPRSRKARATRRSTRPRSRWCGVPIRCRSPRHWSPTKG